MKFLRSKEKYLQIQAVSTSAPNAANLSMKKVIWESTQESTPAISLILAQFVIKHSPPLGTREIMREDILMNGIILLVWNILEFLNARAVKNHTIGGIN